MKYLLSITCFLIFSAILSAQPGAIDTNDGFKPVFGFEKEHHFIWTDNLQNLYLIHESAIEMYNPKGVSVFKNSQMNLGRITSVDFSFSLKPMIFFGEMNAVVVLDNTLSMQGNPVKLNEYGLDWVTAAAKSIDNHYWFFDMQNFELVRTDISFNKVRSSGNISQLLGFDVRPNFIAEHNNWLYVNNPETGILVFDIFGTYFKQIPIKGLKSFQLTDQFIVYLEDGALRQYNLMTFDTVTIPLPTMEMDRARVSKRMLYLSDGKRIRAFQKM